MPPARPESTVWTACPPAAEASMPAAVRLHHRDGAEEAALREALRRSLARAARTTGVRYASMIVVEPRSCSRQTGAVAVRARHRNAGEALAQDGARAAARAPGSTNAKSRLTAIATSPLPSARRSRDLRCDPLELRILERRDDRAVGRDPLADADAVSPRREGLGLRAVRGRRDPPCRSCRCVGISSKPGRGE